MSDEGIITLKNGISLEIKEWLKRKYKTENTTEYGRRCKDEILNLRKRISKRTVKKIIVPDYGPKFSEVRYLTDEEIIKEYIMSPDQEDKGLQVKKSKAYRILALMKQFGGRGVLASVIASGIKENKRNVSAILSQLRSARLIDSIQSPSNKRTHLWKRNPEAICYSLEQMVTIYNDHIRSARKRSKDKSKGDITSMSKKDKGKWKKRYNMESIVQEKEDEDEEEQECIDGITMMIDEEMAGLKERIKKLTEENQRSIKEEELKLSTPLPKTIRVIVEGSIKILIGLDKE